MDGQITGKDGEARRVIRLGLPSLAATASRRAALRLVAGGVAAGATMALTRPAAAAFQDNWRFCRRCRGLVYVGGGSTGVCPAGGAHRTSGSRNYSLLFGIARATFEQDDWRFGKKCRGLDYNGGGVFGVCPKGGAHNGKGSLNSSVESF